MRSTANSRSRPVRRSTRCSRRGVRDAALQPGPAVGVRRGGLALAIVGVYGVMSSAVAQERQEIGIRMALGAERADIPRMVIVRGSRLLLVGMALGLLGSVAAGAVAGAAGLASLGLRSDRLQRSCRWCCSWRASGVLLARPARRAHRSAHRAATGLGRERGARCGAIPQAAPDAHDGTLNMARSRAAGMPMTRPSSCADAIGESVHQCESPRVTRSTTPVSKAIRTTSMGDQAATGVVKNHVALAESGPRSRVRRAARHPARWTAACCVPSRAG